MLKDIIGYSAAFCLVLILFPQIQKAYKTKKLDDIAYGFLFLQFITCCLFLTYGILINELPMIIANSLIFIQSAILFYMKIIYSKDKNIDTNENENEYYYNKVNNIIYLTEI